MAQVGWPGQVHTNLGLSNRGGAAGWRLHWSGAGTGLLVIQVGWLGQVHAILRSSDWDWAFDVETVLLDGGGAGRDGAGTVL